MHYFALHDSKHNECKIMCFSLGKFPNDQKVNLSFYSLWHIDVGFKLIILSNSIVPYATPKL